VCCRALSAAPAARVDIHPGLVDLAAQLAPFVRGEATAAAAAIAWAFVLHLLHGLAALPALLLAQLVTLLLEHALARLLHVWRQHQALATGRRRGLGVVAAAMVLCLGGADTGTSEQAYRDTTARQAGKQAAFGPGCCNGFDVRVCHGVPLP
jgi:hypothetical protein